MVPRPGPPLGTRDARCPPHGCSQGRGAAEGAWFFPGSSRTFGPCPGALRPRSLLCSLSRAPGKEVSRSGGARRRRVGGLWGGGKREGDLTAATAHFTACHALMAEEIKAGMELFIEINQSPRRRGENNAASAVIPGLRAQPGPGQAVQKVPRERPGLERGAARPGPGPAELGPSYCVVPGGVSRSELAGGEGGGGCAAARSRVWGAAGHPAAGLFCSREAAGCVASEGRRLGVAASLGPPERSAPPRTAEVVEVAPSLLRAGRAALGRPRGGRSLP